MKKIDLNDVRYDYDGVAHSKTDIETWFLEKVNPPMPSKNSISYRLKHLNKLTIEEVAFINDLLADLDDILLADPVRLNEYRNVYGQRLEELPVPAPSRKKNRGGKAVSFKEKLLFAFGYNNARQNVLVELASYLNVKTCPYCNLHYTLNIRDFNKNDEVVMMAKLQFDHFYDKGTYPFLSVSLYNLIPSCPVCNQGKSQRLLPLDYHPYHADICKLFKFEVKDPLLLYIAANTDHIELELVEQTSISVTLYDRTFHIKKLYERHKDVAQEEFAKAYLNYYYGHSEFFEFINDSDLKSRLIYGHYHREEDINKRPMTKFKQDLWEQAVRDVCFYELP